MPNEKHVRNYIGQSPAYKPPNFGEREPESLSKASVKVDSVLTFS